MTMTETELQRGFDALDRRDRRNRIHALISIAASGLNATAIVLVFVGWLG